MPWPVVLEDCGEHVVAQIEIAARQALAHDRSGAIVLGCGGMAALCRMLQPRLGVPVLDGVTAAVKRIDALGALGLKTDKSGDYAPPLGKRWVGWAVPLGDSSPS